MKYENRLYTFLVCLIGFTFFHCDKSSDLYENLEYEKFKLKYENKTEEQLEQVIESITDEINQARRRIESTSKKKNEIKETYENFLHPEALAELEDLKAKAKDDSIRLLEANRDYENANYRLLRLQSGSQISVQIITTRIDRIKRFERQITEELEKKNRIDVEELFLVNEEVKEKFVDYGLPALKLPSDHSEISTPVLRDLAENLLNNIRIYKDSLNSQLIRENKKREKEIDLIVGEKEIYQKTIERLQQELTTNGV